MTERVLSWGGPTLTFTAHARRFLNPRSENCRSWMTTTKLSELWHAEVFVLLGRQEFGGTRYLHLLFWDYCSQQGLVLPIGHDNYVTSIWPAKFRCAIPATEAQLTEIRNRTETFLTSNSYWRREYEKH